MATISIYVPAALAADLKKLRKQLKDNRTSLSRWFEERVKAASTKTKGSK